MKRIMALPVFCILALTACALQPVESDPQKAEERRAQIQIDCYKRGGTWNEEGRTCISPDPIRRF